MSRVCVFPRVGGAARPLIQSSALMALAAAGLLASAGQASGLIIGTSMTVQLLSPAPADARLNQLVSTDFARAWDERQSVALNAPLTVDAANPGLYDSNADLGTFDIPAGTIVNSHYLHFDTPGSTSDTIEGFLRFDENIIGVIARGDTGTIHRLDESDFLSSGTLYDNGLNLRGLETGSDRFSISADRRRLEFRFQVAEPGDRLRIITIPAPLSAALVPMAFLMTRRRR